MRLQPTEAELLGQHAQEVERRLIALERRPAGPIRWVQYVPEISYNGSLITATHSNDGDVFLWAVYADLGAAVMVLGHLRADERGFSPDLGPWSGDPNGIGSGYPGEYRIGFPPRWHPTYRRLDDYQLGWAAHHVPHPDNANNEPPTRPAVCYYRPGATVDGGTADALILSTRHGHTGDTSSVGQWEADQANWGFPLTRRGVSLGFGGWFEATREPPPIDAAIPLYGEVTG